MFEKTNATSMHARPMPDVRSGQSNTPELDKEPAWKSEFRQTLKDVRNVGFRAYAEEINEKKLEELRQKILASMGLSESDLDNMNPEQREKIEKMIALEIQQRLAAEDVLENESDGVGAAADGLADQLRAAPNGLGAGVLLMQEMDPKASTEPEKDDLTG